jgi:hypothetical protein
MNDFSREEFELGQLILESLEGDIQKDRFGLLENQIKTDPSAAQQYLDQVMNHAVLMWRCESLHSEADLSESAEDTRFLNAMGEYEKTAPAVRVELPDEFPQPAAQPAAQAAVPAAAARQINKFSLATAIASLAALVFVLIYIEMHPAGSREPMAVITDSVHAVWADGAGNGRQSDVRFYKHTGPMDLKEGYIKIAYDCGTEVIVEGPARFEVTGPKDMSVLSGQLYARSPFSAVGFTVSSPHVKIVDLGTEFGVRVASDGTADVHMMKGKASLIAGRKSATEIIHEGNARQVDTQESMKDIRLQDDLFARQISSKAGLIWRGEDLDLADLVGGGNGLGGGQIGRGINLSTGKQVSAAEDRISDGLESRFVDVDGSPMIDGVFVPGRGPGGNPVISSAGHQFRQCPDTSGRGFSGIYLGQVSQESAGGYLSMVLGEKTSADSLKPVICLYGNAGITFDLDAVRAAIPQSRIGALRAVCGLSSSTDRPGRMAGTGLADIFVLVDGVVSFESRAVSRFSEPRMIRIPISPKDRFVTLIGTEGGASPGTDWVVFAEPCLELTLED